MDPDGRDVRRVVRLHAPGVRVMGSWRALLGLVLGVVLAILLLVLALPFFVVLVVLGLIGAAVLRIRRTLGGVAASRTTGRRNVRVRDRDDG